MGRYQYKEKSQSLHVLIWAGLAILQFYLFEKIKNNFITSYYI